MSLEGVLKSAASNLNPVDFAQGLFDGVLQKPWNALAQLSGDRLPSLHIASEDDSTLAHKAGELGGFAVDMIGLASLTGKLYPRWFYAGMEGPGASALKMGVDGALYKGFL